MSSRRLLLAGILVAGALSALPASAQLHPQDPDPLARIRAAANGQACSTAEPSACAQANPKILSAALGASPLAANLRRLDEIGPRVTGTPGMQKAVAWAMAAFHDAGVDAVETERYPAPPAARVNENAAQENVVAEIRGREKPDEFVLLGANLDSELGGASPDDACNAALVIEAARDIHLTGLRPRRSIRFVLFSGKEQGMLGSWAYVHAHRDDLDHAVAALIFEGGCGRVTGFSLGGREDLEPGVREALAFAPIQTWGVGRDTEDAPLAADNFDFLLEGVPAMVTNREPANASTDAESLKRNTAVAGILAFGLAEHPTPIGSRFSRAEIEALLARTSLDAQMKIHGAMPDWEGGRRGRQP